MPVPPAPPLLEALQFLVLIELQRLAPAGAATGSEAVDYWVGLKVRERAKALVSFRQH